MTPRSAAIGNRMTARDDRPVVHFTAPHNWLNDPNGLIRWRGTYHLFYQHNPHAPHWQRPHWGHASGSDLVRWRDEPIALEPETPLDDQGCFSGCAIDDAGTPTIVYTGVSGVDGDRREQVLLARGTADLRGWTRFPDPVAVAPPDLGLSDFRDPFVTRAADGLWSMIVGGGSAERGGVVVRYTSADLLSWTYRGVLLDQLRLGHALTQGRAWECPQLAHIDGHDVLLLSVWDRSPQHVAAAVGRLSDTGFDVQSCSRVDHGSSFYAPHLLWPGDGRALLFGWSRDHPSDALDGPGRTWAGLLTLPRELLLTPIGVGSRFAEEVRLLRATPDPVAAFEIPPDNEPTTHALPDPAEVIIRGDRAGALTVVVTQQTTANAPTWVLSLRYLPERSSVLISCGVDDEPDTEQVSVPLDPDGRVLTVRAIIDRFVTEIEIDGASMALFRTPRDHAGEARLRVATPDATRPATVRWWTLIDVLDETRGART